MNTFKKKSLYAALAGVSALGVTGAAQAVNVNPDGLGQVLIYPYYTTRARCGRQRVQLAAVGRQLDQRRRRRSRFASSKARTAVKCSTSTCSCRRTTSGPPVSSRAATRRRRSRHARQVLHAAGDSGNAAQALRQLRLLRADGAGVDARPHEGRLRRNHRDGDVRRRARRPRQRHARQRRSAGCDATERSLTDAQRSDRQDGRSGGLFGGMTLINVNAGTDYTAKTRSRSTTSRDVVRCTTNAGSILPDLTQASARRSASLLRERQRLQRRLGVRLDRRSGQRGADARPHHERVRARCRHEVGHRLGRDDADEALLRRQRHGHAAASVPAQLQRDRRCLRRRVDLNIYDREEHTTSTPLDFSPPPPTQTNALCWEANVVTFNNSNVLGSTNVANIPTDFENGWLDIGFFPTTVAAPVHTLGERRDDRHRHLRELDRGCRDVRRPAGRRLRRADVHEQRPPINSRNVLSNYGSSFVQKGTRRIDAALP